MLAIFLDLETTGLDFTKHCVLEIAFKVIDVTTGEEKVSYESIVKQPLEEWQKRDLASMEINGFTWDMVLQGKEPSRVSQEIIDLLTSVGVARGKAVFICQNPAFDRSFFAHLIDIYSQEKLNWPYHWLDFASMYWALLMQQQNQKGIAFPNEINLSKNEIARYHNLPPEEHPHRAMNGVRHLILCYHTVVGMPGHLPTAAHAPC